jgi:Fic family protein
MTNLKWTPIQDLPENWQSLGAPELNSLAALWQEQSEKFKKGSNSALENLNAQLCREWAIETGIIESLYSLDRGVTATLITQGLEANLIPHGSTNKSPEELATILEDHRSALDGVFDFVKNQRSLSSSYIKELHQVFTRHQNTTTAMTPDGQLFETPLLKGDWKKQPNNPSRGEGHFHEYCPPEQVSSEIDQLLKWHAEHIQNLVPVEIQAAWLHHRFAQIHPFQDGNGRVARALASLVFIRGGWFPLTIHRDDRSAYISALEAADQGDLNPLVDLFRKVQKKAFLQALSLPVSIPKRHDSIDQILESASERLTAKRENELKEREKILTTTSRLRAHVEQQFSEAQLKVNQVLKAINPDFEAQCTVMTSEGGETWFREEISQVAQLLGYKALTRFHSSWARLTITTERKMELIVTFHGLGHEFLGLMAASAFIRYRDTDSNSKTTDEGPYLACTEVFQFADDEPLEAIEQRFQPWLETVISMGLEHWSQAL